MEKRGNKRRDGGEQGSTDQFSEPTTHGAEGDAEITDLTYLNPEQLGDNINERRAVYDVYCSTGNGEHFIVEMQKAKQDHFKDRALYYSSFAIRERLRMA